MSDSIVHIDFHTGQATTPDPHLSSGLEHQIHLNGIDFMNRGEDGIQPHRFDSNVKKLQAGYQALQRQDAISANQAVHLARELEFLYPQERMEKYPAHKALLLLPIDSSVPAGARTHTVRRQFEWGSAATHRGGAQQIPTVGIGRDEESLPIRHYVTSIEMDFFEQQASQYAGTGVMERKRRAAERILNQYLNDKSWFGSERDGIYGAVTHPWLRKKKISTAFDGTADPLDVYNALVALEQAVHEDSKSVFRPNKFVTTPRVRNLLFDTPMSVDNNQTIAEKFLSRSPEIRSIEEAHELQGAGEGGTDILFMYRDDEMAVANVIPQPFQALPLTGQGTLSMRQIFYVSHGGVRMDDVLNNIVGLVDA